VITQAELQEYVEQVPIVKRHQEIRARLIELIENGALIEPGPLKAFLTVGKRKIGSKSALEAILGPVGFTELWDDLPPTKIRHLDIRDRDGRPYGWTAVRCNGAETSSTETSVPADRRGH
jgi:hypothetical protein